jgi:hypothetical protein
VSLLSLLCSSALSTYNSAESIKNIGCMFRIGSG